MSATASRCLRLLSSKTTPALRRDRTISGRFINSLRPTTTRPSLQRRFNATLASPSSSSSPSPSSSSSAAASSSSSSSSSSSTSSPPSSSPPPATTVAEDDPAGPVSKHIRDQIKFGGPISVANFMRSALTHPEGGYYMKEDVFGARGDFTTSPEISQMFGELVGIWFITHWQSLGSPKDVRIVELGPGRGTLMADVLRTLAQFPSFHKTIRGVHMVDASPFLRTMQAQTVAPGVVLEEGSATVSREDGLNVHWHEVLDDVPSDMCTMFVAHEFFDAMPIYKFELTEDGWREIVVALEPKTE
ncbi:hypothetical protein HKX48_003056, partial [Thoreauomyces humboldtii]